MTYPLKFRQHVLAFKKKEALTYTETADRFGNGFAHDMPRLYGYSVKGKRCYGQHEWHAKARNNFIGAQLNGKLTTVFTFDCHINSDIFYASVTQDLLPKSTTGAVLVMDNVRASINAKTSRLLYRKPALFSNISPPILLT